MWQMWYLQHNCLSNAFLKSGREFAEDGVEALIDSRNRNVEKCNTMGWHHKQKAEIRGAKSLPLKTFPEN
jgi:hypothetical protein